MNDNLPQMTPGQELEMKFHNSVQMRLLHEVTNECFTNCVSDFGQRKLTDKEKHCITKCTVKYSKSILEMQPVIETQAEDLKADMGFE